MTPQEIANAIKQGEVLHALTPQQRDFAGLDLSGGNLIAMALTGADFRGCNVHQTPFI